MLESHVSVHLASDQDENAEKKPTDAEEVECKPRRKAYVHKPFLYSRYYSDSDDEVTVEERRKSVVSFVNVDIEGMVLAEHLCFTAFTVTSKDLLGK